MGSMTKTTSYKNVDVGGPQPPAARQGRHKQLYAPDGERLVAGCIPVRVHDASLGAEGVEVLLVSSRGNSKGWCLPKGGWEEDESVEAAAKRETVEEAGVRGSLEEPMLGPFVFNSGNKKATPQGCIAYLFVMHVVEELEVWPEGHERKRCWFPLGEAVAKCKHAWMKDALNVWIRRRGWGSHVIFQSPPQQPLPAGGVLSHQHAAEGGGGGVEDAPAHSHHHHHHHSHLHPTEQGDGHHHKRNASGSTGVGGDGASRPLLQDGFTMDENHHKGGQGGTGGGEAIDEDASDSSMSRLGQSPPGSVRGASPTSSFLG